MFPRIGASYGSWVNGKYDPCDEEQCDLIGNVQQSGLSGSGVSAGPSIRMPGLGLGLFDPDSVVRESGSWLENWNKYVSDQPPSISKIRFGEVCVHGNGG